MASVDTERNLLFGLLALQNGLIDQGALFAAFAAWTRNKGRPLADHLIDLGNLDAPRRAIVDAMAGLHVQALGGDAGKSLAVLAVGRSTRASLSRAGGPEVEATLGHVGSAQPAFRDDDDPERTGTYSVGSATSDGQRFRIVRPHARGGLGAVFVALDSELDREVALKQILDDRADDPTSRFRFLIEARITGGLEHPGIVPVYGLGSYGDGRPFYAMRFIRGDSLKEAIDRFHAKPLPAGTAGTTGSRELELRKLLRRFMDVCNAIDYAHSRGVLHRDIKPANIIMGKHGETLVVDWGLAKLLGHVEQGTESGERLLMPSPSSASSETLPGSALGTPAYMSPEQAEGQLERLGPRSDVYSLGATLYCLLTGQPPFSGDVVEVIRAVQKGEFLPPRQLDQSIDPALEAICLQAMAHRPDDRYSTSKALTDDLDRWMADEAVIAWREPFSRRARRWARRNRTTVTGAAVALVAGVVGLATVLAVQTKAKADLAESLRRETNAKTALAISNDELAAEKARVQQRFELAQEAIQMFHKGVSEDVLLKEKQFEALRTKLLHGARDFYRKLEGLLQGQPDRASRKALATTFIELADLTGNIENIAAEAAILRDAVAVLEALAREDPTDAEARRVLGRAWYLFGSRRGTSHGGLSESREAYRRADEILEPMARSEPPDVAARMAQAHVCLALAFDLIDRQAGGEIPEALALQTRARELLEGLARHDPANEKVRYELATSTGMAALILLNLGHRHEANEAYGRSLSLLEELVHAHPDDAEYARELTRVCGNLMLDLDQRDGPRTEERLALGHRAREVCERMAAVYPTLIVFRANKAWIDGIMAEILIDHDRDAEALPLLEEARSIRTDLIRSNPETLRFQETLSLILLDLCAVHARAGRFAEARAARVMSLEIQAGLVRQNPDNPTMLNQQASWLTNTSDKIRLVDRPAGAADRAEEAGAGYRQAVAIRERLVEQHPDARTYRCHLAYSLRRLALVERDQRAAAASSARAAVLFEALPPKEAFEWFELGCCHAALSGMDAPGASPAERFAHSDRAMDLLRKAAALGYRDRTAYQHDPGLSALRDRPEFRLLMMDLTMPADPFAR
jgi:eukaryotic-like serine/threonine-protein kinase